MKGRYARSRILDLVLDRRDQFQAVALEAMRPRAQALGAGIPFYNHMKLVPNKYRVTSIQLYLNVQMPA